MISRDYTKELGIPSDERIVPWPHALAIFAVLAAVTAAAWFGLVRPQSDLPSTPAAKAVSATEPALGGRPTTGQNANPSAGRRRSEKTAAGPGDRDDPTAKRFGR